MGVRDWIPGLRRKSAALAEARVKGVRDWLESLSVSDARQLALEELASGEVFRVVAKPLGAEEHLLDQLSGETRDFFAEFESVDAGSTALNRPGIAIYAADPNFVEIGRDIETVMLAEIGSSRVMIVREADGMERAETHESIWHYLLNEREWSKPKHVPE